MTWTVHQGDCLDALSGMASLPDKSVDVVITDPPYDEHTHSNSVRGRGRKPGGRVVDLGFDAMTQETRIACAKEWARVCDFWTLVCCDVESVHLWRGALEGAGLEYVRTGAWVKIGATPQMTGDRPAIGFEAIVIAHPPGRKRWNGGGSHAVWSFPTAYRDGDVVEHTTQKPLGLMERLVHLFTDPGERILDPFAGSGTTGVAAVRHGRDFVGWEKDERYAAIARRRLGETREQLGLNLGVTP